MLVITNQKYGKAFYCSSARRSVLTPCIYRAVTHVICSALANFISAPGDVNVTDGESLSINCTYTNPDRIFWRREGEQSELSNPNFDISVVDGGTSMLTLTPRADRTIHTGDYECVAVVGGAEFPTNFRITVQCKLFNNIIVIHSSFSVNISSTTLPIMDILYLGQWMVNLSQILLFQGLSLCRQEPCWGYIPSPFLLSVTLFLSYCYWRYTKLSL